VNYDSTDSDESYLLYIIVFPVLGFYILRLQLGAVGHVPRFLIVVNDSFTLDGAMNVCNDFLASSVLPLPHYSCCSLTA
jgi:hypothetical protein